MGLADDDIQQMLDQVGVPATLGATTANVIASRITRDQIPSDAAPISGRVIRLVMKAGTFDGLVSGAVFTINTTVLKARYIRAIKGGLVTEVFCEVG